MNYLHPTTVPRGVTHREVTKEEFYRLIYDGGLNVGPYPIGRGRYTSIFKYLDFGQNGREFGRIEDSEKHSQPDRYLVAVYESA